MSTDDQSIVDRLRGKFLVFDGPDGCGKSTQRELLGRKLTALGSEVVHCKDPGGTFFGDEIRRILLEHDLAGMDVRCEAFLFMASRAQLVGEKIAPALAAGKTVLCDRFISATCAYQVAAGYDVDRVLALGRYAVADTWPDLTIVFDVEPKVGFRRTGRQAHHAGKHRQRDAGQGMLLHDVLHDAMEARPMEFHRRVREAFLNLPDKYPQPLIVIDGSREPDAVHAEVWKVVAGVDF